MLPNLSDGHFYQWMTTAGSLLAVASVIGIWSNFVKMLGTSWKQQHE